MVTTAASSHPAHVMNWPLGNIARLARLSSPYWDFCLAKLELVIKYTSHFGVMLLVTALCSEERRRYQLMAAVTAVGFIPLGLSMYSLVTGQMSLIELHGYRRLLGPYQNLPSHAFFQLMHCAICMRAIVKYIMLVKNKGPAL